MAGDDTAGQAFAEQYDAAAGPLVRAGGDLGAAHGQMAVLLDATRANHEGADAASRVSGAGAPPPPGAASGMPEVCLASPPSAYGGTGDTPPWWHWIAGHVGGLLWPDADAGRLADTGRAWTAAGNALAGWTYAVDAAAAQIRAQHSPEVSEALGACTDLRGDLQEVADAYREMGAACVEFAEMVEQHHDEIQHEVADFVKWTIAIEAGGAVVGALTLGIGEAAAQAAEAAKVAQTAARVVRVLQKLVGLARLCAARVGRLVTSVSRVSARLKGLLGARVVRALERVAPGLASSERAALLRELEAQGVKHTPGDIITIFRDASGRIVFLEKGNASAGFEHVLAHGKEFAQRGIAPGDIPAFLERALTEGKLVGYQGKGTGRPIYELLHDGRVVRIAITVGSNGFIVGANFK